MSISMAEVRHVAKLSRLQLDDEELVLFQAELNSLLGHFEDMRRVENVADGTFRQSMVPFNVWAEDQAQIGLAREAVMGNAAVTRAGLFIVPTIIEE